MCQVDIPVNKALIWFCLDFIGNISVPGYHLLELHWTLEATQFAPAFLRAFCPSVISGHGASKIVELPSSFLGHTKEGISTAHI